jgi:hypothetical protein
MTDAYTPCDLCAAIDDAVPPPGAPGFDALTMFRMLEHVDSPRRALGRARSLLRPGGVAMIESPAVDWVWFRVVPQRWRQLIPDHYFLLLRDTLEALLRRCDLQPVGYANVGREVSLRFLADRLRRSGVPLASGLAGGVRALGIGDRTVRVNPGDIMQVVAIAR